MTEKTNGNKGVTMVVSLGPVLSMKLQLGMRRGVDGRDDLTAV